MVKSGLQILILHDSDCKSEPAGKKVIIPNVADREPILKMINSRARGVFGINDKTGELYLINKEGKQGYSEFYRDRLIQAIDKEDAVLNIRIQNKVDGQPRYDKYTKKKTDNKGVVYSDENGGGGLSLPTTEGPIQNVYISGNDYNVPGSECKNKVKDEDGNSLPLEAADILLNEMVGHGIPKLLNEAKGKNAVEEENKARIQLKPGNNKKREVTDHPAAKGT